MVDMSAAPLSQPPARSRPESQLAPRQLNVLFVAEAEPFYLGETFRGIIETRPRWLEFAALALLDFTPFGARGSVLARAANLTRTFGIATALKTSLRLAGQWLRPSQRLPAILSKGGVELVRLHDVGGAD